MQYDKYTFSVRELGLYILMCLGIVTGIGYLFYSSLWCLLALPVFCFFFLRQKRKELGEKQRRELNLQFKETLRAVAANLQAGYSIENAFQESYQDVCMIYGKESLMAKEIFYMTRALQNNMVLEQQLEDLAKRSQSDDIRDFAEIFKIAKRSGGDINGIIRTCADTISEKMEVEREVYTLLSARQFEQKIMNGIPFIMIAYISISSPGFFDCLYHNPAGTIIMSLCLMVYLAAYFMSRRLITIKV